MKTNTAYSKKQPENPLPFKLGRDCNTNKHLVTLDNKISGLWVDWYNPRIIVMKNHA